MKAILIAGALSLLGTLIGTRFAISVLVKASRGAALEVIADGLLEEEGPTPVTPEVNTEVQQP